jgi:hypothetical protein
MFHRYRYEAEFYPALSRLPLDLRRKLDVTGIKLSLNDWLTFSFEERRVLCHLPCDSDEEAGVFEKYLDFLTRRYLGRPLENIPPLSLALWHAEAVPEAVREKSAVINNSVTLEHWRRWPSHHRYALYKTALSTSQPEAFEQVLKQLREARIDGD